MLDKEGGVTTKLLPMGFPGGPGAGNPPANAGDSGSVPGQRTKIPHGCLCVATTEASALSWCSTEEPPQWEAWAMQQGLAPAVCNDGKSPCTAVKTQQGKITQNKTQLLPSPE